MRNFATRHYGRYELAWLILGMALGALGTMWVVW